VADRMLPPDQTPGPAGSHPHSPSPDSAGVALLALTGARGGRLRQETGLKNGLSGLGTSIRNGKDGRSSATIACSSGPEKADRHFRRALPKTMKNNAPVKTSMIQVMVQGVPVPNTASSNDEMMPLPYCSPPMSAEAEPAICGTSSKAAAVAEAAMMPFMEKNTKIMPTRTAIPPSSILTGTAMAIMAAKATEVACRELHFQSRGFSPTEFLPAPLFRAIRQECGRFRLPRPAHEWYCPAHTTPASCNGTKTREALSTHQEFLP